MIEAAQVRVQRIVCDDNLDPRNGQEIGTSFLAGTGADEVELYIPDVTEGVNVPVLSADGWSVPVETLRRLLPSIVALLDSRG